MREATTRSETRAGAEAGTIPAAPSSCAVLRLLTRMNVGGPARHALVLTRGLDDDFPTVLAAGRPELAEGELTDPRVAVRSVPIVRALRPDADLRALRAVRRLITECGASLLHTHMAKAGSVGRAAALTFPPGRRPRLVHTFHGHCLDGYFPPLRQRAFLEAERALARRTDVLIAVSPEIRDALVDLKVGRGSQYEVIPLGLDLDPYLAVAGPRGTLRSELGIAPAVPLVGIVGRLVPIKDHATLLEAIVRLPDAHLAVIGDGELREELELRTRELGLADRVHFTGWITDVADALADLDVVALSSRNEGTPLALIEALAAARPVVATDVGGVRHIVCDGDTGWLCPPGDPEALAHALGRSLGDPKAAARAAAGRERMAERFGATRLVEEHRRLYRELLRPQGGRRPDHSSHAPHGATRIPPGARRLFRCPSCSTLLRTGANGAICRRGHHFPLHPDGYIDLSHGSFDELTERTFSSFGYEWNTFDRIRDEDALTFDRYAADLDLAALAGRVGLDAGCGKGRFGYFLAPHLDTLVALDGSDAVAAAARNLAAHDNAVVVRADLRGAPLRDASFGFVACLGVLHHLEDPRAGFAELARLLAPDGLLLVYLYSRPPGGGLRAAGLSAAAALRRLTVRMPHGHLRALCVPTAAALWAGLVAPGKLAQSLGAGRLVARLPLGAYRALPIRSLWLDTFDRLSAPAERRYTWEEVRPWYDQAGLDVVSVRDSWGLTIVARRPAEPSSSQGREPALIEHRAPVPAAPTHFPRPRRLHVLALSTYPEDAAATRLRVLQLAGPLRDHGIDVELHSLLSSDAYGDLYDPSRRASAAARLLPAALSQLRAGLSGRAADLVFVQREAALAGPPLIEWLAMRWTPLVLDLDDPTWISYTSPVHGMVARAAKWPGKTEWLIRHAAAVACGSPAICAYVESLGATAVHVPSVVDTARFVPRRERPIGAPVVGWVGSHSTYRYLEPLLPVLASLRETAGELRVRIVGSGREGIRHPGICVDTQPWRLDREVEDFQALDIGLYPIGDDAWARGKSGLKAIQYMAVGIPFVASPVGVMAEIGDPGTTHLLATTPREWSNALHQLVCDAQMRASMGAAGRRHGVEHYGLDAAAATLADVLWRASGMEKPA